MILEIKMFDASSNYWLIYRVESLGGFAREREVRT
jgi:hypothetical protein